MTVDIPVVTTSEYRRRVLGCWLGKAVGGTLGQTFEGLQGPLDADYYVPVPTQMVPNDDLDLQVLYACVLAERASPVVDRDVLAQAWADHVAFPWNEYGVGMRNLAEGILPPFTGSFDNWFTCGEGAAIRSELWACLAPGDPGLAGAYAYEDACFDHAGDGIHAAVFLARLQSLAFVETDPDTLIDGALAGIPEDSGIHRVANDTRAWVAEGLSWQAVRERILAEYGNSDFTDVRPNTGFVILGWLAGSSFGERISITNNCGEDTDSSTASLGALLGILDPDSIEDRWLAPIGRELRLNDEITGIDHPPTIDGFTDLVIQLRERLPGTPPVIPDRTFSAADHAIPVDIAWTNSTRLSWRDRDLTELPQAGSPIPDGLSWAAGSLPGTWVTMPRDDFRDRILYLRYSVNLAGRRDVRMMFNATEHFRVWVDGEAVLAAQGTQYMFPAPHMAPVGQFVDLHLEGDRHELVVALRQPPAERSHAEWVVAVTELSTQLWIPHALRA